MEQLNKKTVKIAKTATQRSIMDVTASLDYRKLNNKGEDVYKGSVIFSITEIQGGKYERAWVSKSKAKMLMYAIFNLQFESIFGANGFTDFGGTSGANPRARIFNVKMSPKKQFIFTVSEGPGKVGETGSIQMVGKPEKTVQTYIAFQDALQLAHEVYDYIRDEEMKALSEGKPLYTLVPYQAQQKTPTTPPVNTPVSSLTVEQRARQKIMEMTEAQLKQLYDKIKNSKEQKDVDLVKLIGEDMMRRKKEQSAG